MSSIIQIKRRTGSTGAPSSLAAGEPAFSDPGGGAATELFIGTSPAAVKTLVSPSRQVEIAGSQTITGTKTIDVGALKITGGSASNVLSTDGAGNLNWVAPAAAAAQGVQHSGQLTYVSATALKFAPTSGNTIFINGVSYIIPTGGISGLANTGIYLNGVAGQNLAANTNYFVYAFNNSGVVTADFSTTAHAVSSTSGNVGTEIKSGDDTRSLIGYIRTNASSQFVNSATQRFVRSWFNDTGVFLTNFLTANASISTGSTLIEISTAIRFEWINWAGEIIDLKCVASIGAASTQATHSVTAIAVDGIVQEGGQYQILYADGYYHSATPCVVLSPTETNHYATMFGYSPGSACSWAGGSSQPRTSLNGYIAPRI